MIVNCMLVKNKKHFEDYGEIEVYGMKCYNKNDLTEVAMVFNDISGSPSFVYDLVEKINICQAYDVHIKDIIEDFIIS